MHNYGEIFFVEKGAHRRDEVHVSSAASKRAEVQPVMQSESVAYNPTRLTGRLCKTQRLVAAWIYATFTHSFKYDAQSSSLQALFLPPLSPEEGE